MALLGTDFGLVRGGDFRLGDLLGGPFGSSGCSLALLLRFGLGNTGVACDRNGLGFGEPLFNRVAFSLGEVSEAVAGEFLGDGRFCFAGRELDGDDLADGLELGREPG